MQANPCNLLLREESGCPALNWPALIASIKAIIVRFSQSEIDANTRSTIKGWLKSDQCAVALMGFTFIHTLSLNAGDVLRQQLAATIWMERLEKLLAKPQHPLVGAAAAQMLVDWAYLFKHDILGMRSGQLVSNPKYRLCFQGVTPSKVAMNVAEELSLRIPPVGPRRGIDFLHLASLSAQSASATFARSSSSNSFASSGSTAASGPFSMKHTSPAGAAAAFSSTPANNSSSGGNTAPPVYVFTRTGAGGVLSGTQPSSSPVAVCESDTSSGPGASKWMSTQQQQHQQAGMGQVLANLTLTPVPLHVAPSMVPSMVSQMQADIAELRRQTAGAHALSKPIPTGTGPKAVPPHIKACVDAGYIAAERCSEWRIRVKELTQTMADPSSLAALLHEVDQANTALQGWQQYASGGTLFQALGLPPSSSSRWRSQLRQQLQHHHHHYQQQQQHELQQQQQRGYTGYQEALLVDLDDIAPPPGGVSPGPPTPSSAPPTPAISSKHQPWPILTPPEPPWPGSAPPAAADAPSGNPFVDPQPNCQQPQHASLVDPFLGSLSLPPLDASHASSATSSLPPSNTPPLQPAPAQAPTTYNPFAQQHNHIPGATSPATQPACSQASANPGWALFSPADQAGQHGNTHPPLLGQTSGPPYASIHSQVSNPNTSLHHSHSSLSNGPFAGSTGGGQSMQQQRQQQQQQQRQQQQQAQAARSASYAGNVPLPGANGFARSHSMGVPHASTCTSTSSNGSGAVHGGPTGGSKPQLHDWNAELAQLLAALQRPLAPGGPPQVQPGAASQIEALFKRMQLHYEGLLSSTKAQALGVYKDMQSRYQQQQQQQQQHR
eukprot:CAMPEP_0202348342 /NCGR_PEP_ID=MMETSP1126-20121109/6312_1 /ASSEMBLY_ACC=CAM_ASM_000457 /TAXON_ID=3047 /ORGANISM="Dunaliella tertiolecta, Strain CCMP1320" /LENGTH=835 /DNA_ID=CAMNT_0048940013 /DNA_START=161 /DNA_END=2668 /DNA_ORIENTATION=+